MGGGVVGDIAIAPIPYTDLSGVKNRPVLVLADAGMGDWVVCAMTGSERPGEGGVAVAQSDVARGRLLGDGWARPGRLYTLNERILRTVGGVSDAKLAEVRSAARALFG